MNTPIDGPVKDPQGAGADTRANGHPAPLTEARRKELVEKVIKQFGTFPDFPTNEQIEEAQLSAEAARRDR
ncbi:MAG: hypothetical protein ACO1QR_00825 [Chthoniobacteraceae bacterium]